VSKYGEEKVQTPNPGPTGHGAVKAVVGMNQQVVGSSPSAGSINRKKLVGRFEMKR